MTRSLRRDVTMLFVLMLVTAVSAATAGELLHPPSVERRDERYTVFMDVRIGASRTSIFEAVTDYENLSRISGSIMSSRIVQEKDLNRKTILVHLRICILEFFRWKFCPELDQTQQMTASPPLSLRADIPDDGTNIFQGYVEWKFTEEVRGTKVEFRSELTPLVEVFPILGPWAIKRALRREAHQIFEGLERFARKQAADADEGEARTRRRGLWGSF